MIILITKTNLGRLPLKPLSISVHQLRLGGHLYIHHLEKFIVIVIVIVFIIIAVFACMVTSSILWLIIFAVISLGLSPVLSTPWWS